jgi:hypothetical protein
MEAGTEIETHEILQHNDSVRSQNAENVFDWGSGFESGDGWARHGD